MTTNLAKSASNNGQIIKSWLPNDRRAKFLPSVVGNVYDWLRVGGHLGNVDLKHYINIFHARYSFANMENGSNVL